MSSGAPRICGGGGGGGCDDIRFSIGIATSYVKNSLDQIEMLHFQIHRFCMTIIGLVPSSPVLVYPYNSLCSRLGDMHCKASNACLTFTKRIKFSERSTSRE